MRRGVFIQLLTALLFLNSGFILGQQEPTDLLASARRKVMDTVDRLPKYMCSLTIDRQQYEAQSAGSRHSCDDLAAARKSAHWKTRLAASDRLRLDVAIADIQEMYSWAGANRFDDRELDRLVNFGASTTGDFSGFL